jgi:hypothetical protein
MNRHELTDDALDDQLRALSPEPLADNGFVARTMAALELADRGLRKQGRAAPCSPMAIERALAAEQRRHEAQMRLWRWAIAGVIAGFILLVFAVLLSPASATSSVPPPLQWFQLSTLLAVGATWAAWRELRS